MLDHQHISNTYINASNGYWSVGEEFFFSKVPALIRATKNKQKVRYHFNEHVYNTIDWRIQPQESLQELYLQRALELREKYDYLVILYSAGSDSTNMIKTFIKNGIKIDHVMSWGSKNNHYGDYSPSNSEITIAGSAMIKELISMGIKFTFENFLEDELIKKTYHKEDWILDAGASLSPHAELMSKGMFAKKELLELAHHGKKVCFIWGKEKPAIELIKEKYYLVFRDILNELCHATWNSPEYPLYHEFFYQRDTTTTTKIIAKQSHIIIEHLEKNYTKEYIETLLSSTATRAKWEEFNRITNSLIYADTWTNTTFTTGKPNSILRPHKLEWFFKDENTKQFKIWQSGILNATNNIDPIYKKDVTTKWQHMLCPFKKSYFLKSAR